jgi:uncharacterized repeat protein (TIGR01451 family)
MDVRPQRRLVLLIGLALTLCGHEALASKLKISAGPALGITMLRVDSDDRPLIAAGQNLTISIGVDNLRGGAAAHNAVLKVSVPNGLKLVQASTPPTSSTADGAELTWELGTIGARAFPQIFELTLSSATNLPIGTQLTLAATVVTGDHDADTKNNHSAFTALVGVPSAALAVRSDLAAVPLTLDGPVKFTAEVTNLGTLAATASALTLTLPPKLSFKSSDPPPATTNADAITWQLGDILADASQTVTITISVDMSLGRLLSATGAEINLKFRFDASTTTAAANRTANHLEVDKRVELAGADVKVWLSVQGANTPGELRVGKDVTYTVLYGNFGNAQAKKAVVTLSLPPGLALLRAEPPPASTHKNEKTSGDIQSWDAGDLEVGISKTIKCHVHVANVPDEGSLVRATISSASRDINSGESTAYSLRYAENSAKRVYAAAHPSHPFGRLLFFAIVFSLIVVIALRVLRARRG